MHGLRLARAAVARARCGPLPRRAVAAAPTMARVGGSRRHLFGREAIGRANGQHGRNPCRVRGWFGDVGHDGGRIEAVVLKDRCELVGRKARKDDPVVVIVELVWDARVVDDEVDAVATDMACRRNRSLTGMTRWLQRTAVAALERVLNGQ